MERLMVTENTLIKTEHNIKVCGKTIYSMEKPKKLGLMDLNFKVIMSWEKNQEKVFISGQINLIMKEIGLIIKLKE